jgi:glycosyltransferase involved in cell wall biosynthesis
MTRRPLKILLSDPHLRGGGQVRYVSNLAAELKTLGHDVTILCKPGSVLLDKAAQAGCPCIDKFVFKGGMRLRAWLSDLRRMTKLIQSATPDIVHASGSQDHWIAALANRWIGRTACLVRTRHNTYPVSQNAANRLLNRRLTDYQIVVCEIVRRDLEKNRAFDASRMCSIHNGVDARKFLPHLGNRQKARTEFGYDNSHIVCGIAARLVSAKGHEFLFQAIAALKETNPNLRLLVLGHGDLDSSLRKLASELQIDSIVHFAGFRDDMDYCVQAIDIGVQPSIDCDTSSFSLKEQMACEKPVVASNYGGLTEIVADGEEGFVVAARTVEPLADAIAKLTQDANLRAAMGKAGRRRVLKDFTVQVFANRTVEAYYRALDFHRALGFARAGILD